MRKLSLLLSSVALSLTAVAQSQQVLVPTTPIKMGSHQQVSTEKMDQLYKNSPYYLSHHAHDTKRLIPGLVSYNDWYDLWDQNYTPGVSQNYYFTIYPDSSLIDDFLGGTNHVFDHGMGMSFDPTDSGYSYSAITSGVAHPLPPTGQGYTIDSFYVPITYLRNNPNPAVVDSVIIELVVTSNTGPDSGAYNLHTAAFPAYYPITYDETPRNGNVHYNNGLTAPYNVNPYINDCYFDSIRTRKYRYALALTNANKYDTASNGSINLNQAAHQADLPLSPAIPIYSSNNYVVSFVSFKSGTVYPFSTHTSAANVIHCFAGEPLGFSTWFRQSTSNAGLTPVYPGSYQAGLYATNSQRYDNPGFTFDYHNILLPGNILSAPGFSVPLDQWHITWSCTTPSVGAILGASSSVCVGSTITVSDTASLGAWSASNANASISGSGVITGVAGGVDTITYTKSSGCGTATATKTITVFPILTPGIITGPSIVCTGATISLTDAATGGTWSETNLHASVSGGVVTGLTVGTDTILYFVSNVCGTFGTTKIITINPSPVPGTITGLSGVCIGSTITLTDAATGGAWSTSLGNATVAGGLVTGVTVGIDTVNYKVSNSCGSLTAKSTIAINPLPVPVIVNTAGVLSTTVSYGGYQWNVSGSPITGETNSTYTVLLNGDYSVSVTDANGCSGSSGTAIVVLGISIQNINAIAANISVYPNPAQSIINIQSSVKVNLQLATMDGRVIMDKQDVSSIDVSGLPNGNYLLNIYDADTHLKLKTDRVVKLAN